MGGVSAWTRRLGLASTLHAGVTKSRLTTQVALETLAWTVAGAAVAGPIAMYFAQLNNPDPWSAAFVAGLRSIGAICAGVMAGALVGTSLITEKHLFRYFKER